MGNFTVEIEVPACFTDRSHYSGGAAAGSCGGATSRCSIGGGMTQRGSRTAREFASPGYTSNPTPGPHKVDVGGRDVHMVGDPGAQLMPYGCCTPLGLVALAEVVRVLLPGAGSLESNAELQGIFGVLRLVQALFLSAPLLYFQLWTMLLLELPKNHLCGIVPRFQQPMFGLEVAAGHSW